MVAAGLRAGEHFPFHFQKNEVGDLGDRPTSGFNLRHRQIHRNTQVGDLRDRLYHKAIGRVSDTPLIRYKSLYPRLETWGFPIVVVSDHNFTVPTGIRHFPSLPFPV